MSAPTLTVAVKPAYDYHKPGWQFPAQGKVIALGFGETVILESTFRKRVHFWQSLAIQRKQDIPENISAIFVHQSLKNNEGENRRISDCARARNIPVFVCAHNNDLNQQLHKIFIGALISVDPDRAEPPAAIGSVQKTNNEIVTANGDKPKGWIRQFFKEKLDLGNSDVGAEIERVRLLIKTLHSHEMSIEAARQQYYAIRNDQAQSQPAATRNSSVTPVRFQIGNLEAAAGQIKVEFDQNLRNLQLRLENLVALAKQVDRERQGQSTDLARERAENATLREQIRELREKAVELASIKKTLAAIKTT